MVPRETGALGPCSTCPSLGSELVFSLKFWNVVTQKSEVSAAASPLDEDTMTVPESEPRLFAMDTVADSSAAPVFVTMFNQRQKVSSVGTKTFRLTSRLPIVFTGKCSVRSPSSDTGTAPVWPYEVELTTSVLYPSNASFSVAFCVPPPAVLAETDCVKLASFAAPEAELVVAKVILVSTKYLTPAESMRVLLPVAPWAAAAPHSRNITTHATLRTLFCFMICGPSDCLWSGFWRLGSSLRSCRVRTMFCRLRHFLECGGQRRRLPKGLQVGVFGKKTCYLIIVPPNGNALP